MQSLSTVLLVVIAVAIALGVLMGDCDLLNPITSQAEANRRMVEVELDRRSRLQSLELELKNNERRIRAAERRDEALAGVVRTVGYAFAICLLLITVAFCYRLFSGVRGGSGNSTGGSPPSDDQSDWEAPQLAHLPAHLSRQAWQQATYASEQPRWQSRSSTQALHAQQTRRANAHARQH